MTPGQRYELLRRASLALREAGCDDIDDQVIEVADTVWLEMSEDECAEANARAAAHARGITLGTVNTAEVT